MHGAIVAQIAMTSLMLPRLDETHWTTTAFFVVSLVSGLLAVYFAVMIQGVIGGLYRAEHIRLWLSVPAASKGYLRAIEKKVSSMREHHGATNTEPGEYSIARLREALTPVPIPSIYSALLLIMPGLMLNISISTLLTALGLYIGFVWTRELDTAAGPHDWRNVFIFYIIGAVVMICFYFVPSALKDDEIKSHMSLIRALERIEGTKDTSQMASRAVTAPVGPPDASLQE
jgi:hypothetical protein